MITFGVDRFEKHLRGKQRKQMKNGTPYLSIFHQNTKCKQDERKKNQIKEEIGLLFLFPSPCLIGSKVGIISFWIQNFQNLTMGSLIVQDSRKMTAWLFFVFLFIQITCGQKDLHKAPPSSQWRTLSSNRPSVVARGGFSGLFPDSSDPAIQFAVDNGLDDITIYCSLQISKDGHGYCLSSLTLDNATNIADVYPDGEKTHNVNGQQVEGHFVLDYTSLQLSNITMRQGIFSRPSLFDDLMLNLSTVETVASMNLPKFWLNVQNNNFYAQNKLNPALYVENLLAITGINYISSPEIGFLKSMNSKVDKAHTKFVFVFLEPSAVEPTTNKTYSALLKDLSSIKIFASVILVPKAYIWPVNPQMYLDKPTTLVQDAHRQGLEVYAYNFANDYMASYNYSYDPVNEYLSYIDNSEFSVDGFLTDFPSTASESIACFAHKKNVTRPGKGKALVITHNGASGIYPGSTDLAYWQAVEDGADIIDCSVQMSKDGVAFCLNTTDLASASTAKASFLDKSATVPEIQGEDGIFSFDLSWSEIQTLQPLISSPYISATEMQRNPANKSEGKFLTLAGFLEFAKEKKVAGVMINIQNAAYLASKKGLSITDAVTTALSNATFDKQTTQQVLIQSDDTSVLSMISNNTSYKRVLLIEEIIGSVTKPAVDEIKKYANAVNLQRRSIIATSNYFTTASTDLVQEMHKANISVYVSVFRNEFVSIAFDFFSDPYVEFATFVKDMGIDGVITEYPATATAYMRSPCSDPNAKLAYTLLPVRPGDLLKNFGSQEAMTHAVAPSSSLTVDDVIDPPLPPVAIVNASSPAAADATPALPPGKSSQPLANAANLYISLILLMVAGLPSLGL